MKVRTMLTSRRITNMFGAIGYSVLITAYAVVVGAVMFWLIRGGYSEHAAVVPQESVESIVEQTDPGQASLLVSIFAYSITIVMLLTVLFVTVTLPYWLGKSGSYILRRAIRLFSVPVTPTSLLLAKLIANGIVCVPILLIAAEDMGNLLTLIFVSGLMGLTLVLFLLQHYLARMNHLEAKEIW